MAAGVDDILNDLIARVGRVRRWLLALSVLRIAALGLACVSLYIGGYAWLDHHIHFGTLGRVSSLALFLTLVAAGLYFVVRVLRRDMTYANAANFIEGKRSFDQQLVAAVEYYEGRGDYPYSKALAAQLVRQVDSATQDYRFDSTIEKWQGYLLAGFVLLSMCIVGLFVRQNVLFISSYLARLIRPFSSVAPMPAAALKSATDDIVAGVDTPVTFEAAIEGRAPESATLVLTPRDPNDPNAPSTERIELARSTDSEGRTTFTTTKSFDATGRFRYRFETPEAQSDSHELRVCELPSIQRVTAKVFPPGAPQEGRDPNAVGSTAAPGQPYEVELTDQPLAVLPHSRVELSAQASTGLREATMVGPDGQPVTRPLQGENHFGFEFTADKPSSIQLNAVSVDGLTAGKTKELQVVLKSDERPQFKLVSPEGDCLATDVASIPIAFEVTDDFGLESAELVCELPGRVPAVLKSVSLQGIRQTSLTQALELEQGDLHVGDAVLFYARARDIDTGHRPADANACSEVYLIEIRPYRQYWHVQAGNSQSMGVPGPMMEDLLAILEYTRAVVKKTWTLARSPGSAAEDHPKLKALAEDIQYCATRLTKIRDDPDSGFNEGDKAVANRVLESYEKARGYLENNDPNAALPSVQDAYRILRMFIDELHLKWTPPQNGASVPQETPERVKLQEQPQEPEADKDRVENQLQEMQQKIDSLAKQEESLKADFAKAMRQEKNPKAGEKAGDDPGGNQSRGKESKEAAGNSQSGSSQQGQSESQDKQASAGESGSAGSPQGQSSDQQSVASQQGQSGSQDSQGRQKDGGQASSGEKASGKPGDQGQSQGQQAGDQTSSGENASEKPGGEGQSQGQQAGDRTSSGQNAAEKSGEQGQPQGQQSRGQQQGQSGAGQSGQAGQHGQSSQGRSGSAGSGQGKGTLGQSNDATGQGSAQADARMRMLQARQKALREQASQVGDDMGELADAGDPSQGQASQEAKEHLDHAVEAMKEFEKRLADARYGAGDSSQAEGMADLADSAARRLADAGQAIRRVLGNEGDRSADEAKKMAEQLAKDAETYDESLSEAEKQKMLDRLKAAERLLESMAGAQWTTVLRGGGAGAAHAYTSDSHTSPSDAARLMAQQFWSMALKDQNRRSQPIEQEPSDVKFFEAETEFFENAAKFGSHGADK
ncbi:MAG: hypothetical protein ABFE01_10315 [Phycisphaerales bacterium]